MEIQIDLEKQDWVRYQAYVEKKLQSESKTVKGRRWITALTWVVTIAFMLALNFIDQFDWPTAAYVSLALLSLCGVVVLHLAITRKTIEPANDGVFCGRHTFTFTEEGIASRGHGYHGLHSWDLVKHVVRAQGLILIFLDSVYAYVLPESKLPNPDEVFDYVTRQHQLAASRS
jgi:hypothetical protein